MSQKMIPRIYFGISLFLMFFIGWSVGVLSYQGIIHVIMLSLWIIFGKKVLKGITKLGVDDHV